MLAVRPPLRLDLKLAILGIGAEFSSPRLAGRAAPAAPAAPAGAS
jgi:hypothetical protein